MCYVWFKYVANVDFTFALLDIQFDPNLHEFRWHGNSLLLRQRAI